MFTLKICFLLILVGLKTLIAQSNLLYWVMSIGLLYWLIYGSNLVFFKFRKSDFENLTDF